MKRPDDRGLTLVELIVAILIAGLFTGLLTIMFVAGWTAQQRTAARDLATGTANTTGALLTTSVRNATQLYFDGTGQRLDAKVVRADGVLECRAWLLDGGSLKYGHSTAGRVAVGDLKVIQTGASGTLDAGKAFVSRTTTSVDVGLSFTKGGIRYGETVDVRSTLTAQAQATGGPASC